MALILNGGPMQLGSYLKGSRLCAQPLLSIKKKGKGGVALTRGEAVILNVEVIFGARI